MYEDNRQNLISIRFLNYKLHATAASVTEPKALTEHIKCDFLDTKDFCCVAHLEKILNPDLELLIF